ncbi:MAG: hypothetical protein AAFY71_21640 [Bacteroidota bacterium]
MAKNLRKIGTQLTAILLASLVMVFFSSCNQGLATDTPENQEPLSDLPKESLPIGKSAVCIWTPYASLRHEPGKKYYTKDKKPNWICTIRYGERVEYLDSTYRVENEKKDYIKVRLKDGNEGWTQAYLFEKEGIPAVVLDKTELYRRPDPMTLRDDVLEPGNIIVVIKDSTSTKNSPWMHVSGKRKYKKGWIYETDHISTSTRDVKASLLFYKANESKSTEEKLERLQAILEMPGFDKSPLYATVQEKIKQVENEAQKDDLIRPGAKLFVVENNALLRSTPDIVKDNQLLELSQDAVCIILGIGERDSIGAMYDFWYKVQFQETDGWIYGHYTSMRNLD